MAEENIEVESQKGQISSLMSKKLQKGDTWYLLDNIWYTQWKKYVGYDGWDTSSTGDSRVHPGPVDNSLILYNGEFKKKLTEELHYMVLPEEAWDVFMSWYGICDGQVAIARKVIETGVLDKSCEVEVYLVQYKLCLMNNLKTVVTCKFSKGDTIYSIEMKMRELFDIPQSTPVRLWNMDFSKSFKPLKIPHNIIRETCLYSEVIVADYGLWSDHSNKPTNPLVQESQITANAAMANARSKPTKACGKQLQTPLNHVNKECVTGRGKFIDQSEEMITCIVCFNVMTYPQMLPCQHTFCNSCVCQLPNVMRNQKKGVTCPTCRNFSPRKDIQSNLMVKKMLDFHLKQKKAKDEHYCNVHPSYKIEGRCIPCNTEICLKCKFGDHDVHPSESFDTAIERIQPQVTDKMSSISKHVDDMENSISNLAEKKKSLKVGVSRQRSHVQDEYNKLMTNMDRSWKSVEKEINSKIEHLQCAVNDHKKFISSRQKTIGETENVGLWKVLQETQRDCDQMRENIGKKTTLNLVEVSFENCECGSKCLTGRVKESMFSLEVTKVGE